MPHHDPVSFIQLDFQDWETKFADVSRILSLLLRFVSPTGVHGNAFSTYMCTAYRSAEWPFVAAIIQGLGRGLDRSQE